MTTEQKRINRLATGDIVDIKRDIPDVVNSYMLNTLHKDEPGKVTQGQFNAILLNIQDVVITPNLCMLEKGNIHNRLRDDILQDLFDIYIRLCMEFDKHCCVYGFSCMTGIEDSVIHEWGKDRKASQIRKNIYKKLLMSDEQTLQDLLITGKRNPVGIVAVLNNKHGWSSQNIRHEHTAKVSDNLQIAQDLGLMIESKEQQTP